MFNFTQVMVINLFIGSPNIINLDKSSAMRSVLLVFHRNIGIQLRHYVSLFFEANIIYKSNKNLMIRKAIYHFELFPAPATLRIK